MTAFDVSFFFTTFATVFVIVDPAGNLPVFMSLMTRMTPNERERAAWQAALASLVVFAVSAFFGQQILRLLGVSVASVQISGGLLLLIVVTQLLSSREEGPGKPGATNVALVPLGAPLLAGPGAIAAVMLAADQAAGEGVGGVLACIAAMLLIHIVKWLMMRFANPFNGILGEGGTIFFTKISGMLLAAIAAQFIISGVTSVVEG